MMRIALAISLRRLTWLLVAAVFAAGTGFGATAQAQNSSPTSSPSAVQPGFTAAQRDEIVRIVRDALRRDPSILRDAVQAMQADEGRRQEAEARDAIGKLQAELVATASDQVAGNAQGDVTIVEFYDPRCPYCRRMVPVMAELLRTDPGVRIVYKDLPVLGPASLLESRALMASQKQGGYLKLRDLMMRSPPDATIDSVRAMTEKVGLDWARLARDMDDPVIKTRVDANLKLAEQLGIQGTPAFVIGRKLLPGAVDLGEMRQTLAEARGR